MINVRKLSPMDPPVGGWMGRYLLRRKKTQSGPLVLVKISQSFSTITMLGVDSKSRVVDVRSNML
ncbi:MAG: hypothetical protein IBX64_03160 [Actinobacteria bacterium]|nr:hypothetical protein [Actinomycetota bacterium]